MPGVTVHIMTQDHLNFTENIWDQAKDVKDISKTLKTVLKNGKLVIYPNAKSDTPSSTVVFEDQSEQTVSMTVSNIKVGDFVKLIKDHYYGNYAVLTGESYGSEIKIDYFQKEKNFVIKENGFDSRIIIQLKRVQGNPGHYSFEEQL